MFSVCKTLLYLLEYPHPTHTRSPPPPQYFFFYFFAYCQSAPRFSVSCPDLFMKALGGFVATFSTQPFPGVTCLRKIPPPYSLFLVNLVRENLLGPSPSHFNAALLTFFGSAVTFAAPAPPTLLKPYLVSCDSQQYFFFWPFFCHCPVAVIASTFP